MIIETKHRKAIQGVGLQTPTASYQLDHLAVICSIMKIPLLILDENDFQIAKKYYPQVESLKVDYDTFTPEALIEEFDFLVTSELSNPASLRLYRSLEQRYQKKVRHLFCPHGFSDKTFYFKSCVNEDIVLFYGKNMRDLFEAEGLLDKMNDYVVVGNYRYLFYKKYQQFYDNLAEVEIWSRFSERKKTILYAPTWRDKEDSTTFFDATATLIDHLPSEYNLLIKTHPRLELDDTALYYELLGRCEELGNLLFINQYPHIYSLLAGIEIYLGDMSSVGYDYLAFDRPMFFLDKGIRPIERNLLRRCGVSIPQEQYREVYRLIKEALPRDEEHFSSQRKKLYDYTFAEQVSLEAIGQAVNLKISEI